MKKMLKTKVKDMNAITLIALVVTIIILLILAGVTIGVATNGTGLFEKAKLATDEYNNKAQQEEKEIAKYSNEINSHIDGNRDNIIENFTGSFYLIGTNSNTDRMKLSYFEISVKNYKKMKIEISNIDGTYCTCQVIADDNKVLDITSKTTYELDVTAYSKVKIYYCQDTGWDSVIGTYELTN